MTTRHDTNSSWGPKLEGRNATQGPNELTALQHGQQRILSVTFMKMTTVLWLGKRRALLENEHASI